MFRIWLPAVLALASTMGSVLFLPAFALAAVGVYGHGVMVNFVDAGDAPFRAVSAWGVGFFGTIVLAIAGLFV